MSRIMGVKPVAITSSWAVSVASLNHLTQEKVAALVERSHGRDPGAPLRTSEIFERLQPLAKYLRYGEGKFSTSVVSEVTQLLLHVPAVWDKVEGKPLECQASAAEVLADLAHWLFQQADLPELEEAASRDVKELLVSFLSHAPAQQQEKPEEYARTGCSLLLRAITRSPQFAASQPLPMLPADALLVLDWLHSHMLQPSLLVEGFDSETGSPIVKSIGGDGSPLSSQDAAKMQRAIQLLSFLDDDKVLLLVYHIVCTAVAPGCTELAPPAVDVLVHVVSWACSIVRGALAYLLEGSGDQWLGSVTSASRRGSQASYSASSAAPNTPPALSREGLLRVPSGKATRAAAKLASGVVQCLLQAAESMDDASITQVQRQVASVVEVLLDMVEACVSAAGKMPAGEPAADKVLDVAGNVLLDAEPLVLAYLDAGYNATALTARLRGLLLACARTADHLDTAAFKAVAASGQQAFAVRHNSLTGTTMSASTRVMHARSSSTGSLFSQITTIPNGNMSGGAYSSMGATSGGWLSTAEHPLHKWQWNLLDSLLENAPTASQGEGWAPHWMCRAVAEVLCRSMGACWKGGRQEAVQALLLLPDTTSTHAEQQVVALAMARLFVLLKADQELGSLMVPILAAPLTSSNIPSPPVSACITWALVHMAASSALGDSSTMWSFHQITELLVKLYREPLTGVGRNLMFSKPDAVDACPGALAAALGRLALSMRSGQLEMRILLRSALLQLFSDLGLGLTWSNQGGLQDLGSLLPAVAAACDGLESRITSVLRSGANRLSSQDIQAVQRQDANLIKLFRTLWLYCGMFKLADRDAPTEWRAAAGKVAAATPILLVTEGPQRVQGQNQRLKAELSNRLAKAGSVAEPTKLSARLLAVCGLQQTSLPALTEPAKTAYLLAIATAEMCRTSLGPLPGAGDYRGEPAPVAVMQAYLETAPPDSTDVGWLTKIADLTFNRYLQRLVNLQAGQATAVAGVDGEVDDALVAESCAIGLAATLTTCLTSTRPARDGQQPISVQVADNHLTTLLAKWPSLYWSPAAIQALLEGVESQSSHSSPAWRHLQAWVGNAARKAPARTESLLHLFMGASPRGVSPGAHSSALRHSVALLAACKDARRQGTINRSDEAHAMLALARKSYYSGIVSGLAGAAHSKQSHCVQISTQLRDVLEQSSAPLELVTEYYLRAAALLACSDSKQMAPADTHKLLVLLASAPLKRFTLEFLSIASFAWNWVICSTPEYLPTLFTEIASAWTWSVDRQMGLFSDETETTQELVEGVDSHHRWLQFLTELWETLWGRMDDAKHTVRQVLQRMLQHSLRSPERLCSHPASISARFRVLALTLRLAQRLNTERHAQSTIVALLHDRVIQVALLWFQESPAWYWCSQESAAHEQYMAVKDFLDLITTSINWPTVGAPMALFPATNPVSRQLESQLNNMSFTSAHSNEGLSLGTPSPAPAAAAAAAEIQPHPVWGCPNLQLPRIESCVQLLSFLCKCEVERLKVWADPQQYADPSASGPAASLSSGEWRNYTHTAWALQPKLAVALLQRFPSCQPARTHLEALICAHATKCAIQEIPEAAVLMASSKTAQSGSAPLATLCSWAPADAGQALQLLSGPTGNIHTVKAYAIRCLQNSDAEEVTFFLPQLVQALRNDQDGALKLFMRTFARRHAVFAHHLIWSLQSEEKPPESAFNPEVKRSGWQAPKDFGLWNVAGQLKSQVEAELSLSERAYWYAERDYFNNICEISGVLKPFSKDERRARTQLELEKVKLECHDLYLPTNPHSRVLGHIPSSGTPMPSAAKVPILVAFEVEDSSLEGRRAAKRKQQYTSSVDVVQTPVSVRRTQALIFKVGDDVRQDVLALQVITILKFAFRDAGLDLYLHPYGVLPTGYEKGIIEVVPNTKSRSAVGEITEGGLYEYFINTYGAPGTPTFESARRNFIISEAGYAIASFLLQCKDRHNGNILIDQEGHLVHIDFGFILEISPGGNMGFESAAFKLSHEMTQLLDPGGTRSSAYFKMFTDLCIRGFLAARSMAEPIIASVALMADSGLPCFSRGQPIQRLRQRFQLDKSDKQAAAAMRDLINDAYQKWTTGFYDYIQYLQNHIPM